MSRQVLSRWKVVTLGMSLALVAAQATAAETQLNFAVSNMDGDSAVVIEKGEPQIVVEGPQATKVSRFDSDFGGRIDLKPLQVDPHKFDLIKVEVKADRGAFLRFSLENFPQPGQLSHWYVLDTARGPLDWQTIWIDLNKPEEVKEAGTYKGMSENDPSARGLRFDGFVKDLKRAAQGPGRTVWLGKIRFCNQAVDLDWDQAKFSYTWAQGKDLVYTYPLAVTNKLDKPITATLGIAPFRVAGEKSGSATAKLASEQIALAPRESKMIDAVITLPAAVAAKSPPLYTETFQVSAAADGVADSQVTVLRSSDPIHLVVCVPVAEAKLAKFPLLPHDGKTPVYFVESKARAEAEEASPDDLNLSQGGPLGTSEAHEGLYPWAKKPDWASAGQRYLAGTTACAFLYNQTGEKKYLDKGTALLLRAAELYGPRQEQWRKQPYSMISHGVFAQGTLRSGWAMGGMRPAYAYDRHGLFNDFDLLAPGMNAATREKMIREFIVPAAIQMRNHYFGLSNQQDVVNYPVLYAGLVSRNWPLAAFALHAEHGILGQLEWGFTDDGLAGEVNYHSPALDGITWTAELLHRVGINIYDARLYECIHSRAAKALGKPFGGPIVAFLDEHRFPPELRSGDAPTDGTHLASGMTLLKWNGKEVCMNWGEQLNRSACDRCALRISEGSREGLLIGGGNYTHSSIGQSIIIVDEGLQNPVPAEVTGVDVTGPVQFVQAASEQHYPGVMITRTFALVDKHVLVVDRVASLDGTTHTVDWCLRYRGGIQTLDAVAKSIDLPLQAVAGSFTEKPADTAKGADFGARLRGPEHFVAKTSDSWRQSNGNLLMLGAPGTQVMAFAVPASYSAWKKEVETGVPVMMARRAGITTTDYLTAFSPDVKSLEQLPVKTSGGKSANAIGVKVTLRDGKSFHAIVNYEPAGKETALGKLKTKERFATDWE